VSTEAKPRRCVVALAAATEEALRARVVEACDGLGYEQPTGADGGSSVGDGNVRIVATGASAREVGDRLRAFLTVGECDSVRSGAGRSRLAFVFTGQSETRPGMGAALYETNDVFARAVDNCSAAAEQVLGASLSTALYVERDDAVACDARLAQPALLALQCGLMSLWRHWGVAPHATAGHSLGEYAAACSAGVMNDHDAMALVARRGQITHERARPGSMAVVFASENVVTERLVRHARLTLAALNAPDVVVAAGPEEDIADFMTSVKADGITVKPLRISHAFHSWCVDPILDPLERAASAVSFQRASIPYASALEGRMLSHEERLDARYWRRHAREPVRFFEAVQSLVDADCTVCLELGPHATLTSLGERCSGDAARWIPSLTRSGDDHGVLGEAAIALWLAGIDVRLRSAMRDLGWEWLRPHGAVGN